MALSTRLQEMGPAVAEAWLADALAVYPADSAAVFRREKDPFANPVGHALRVGTRAAVEALLDGGQPEEVCSHLQEVVKMRAVQELPPSQAVSFVFSLKEALRRVLGAGGPDAAGARELAEFERRIDRIALGVFDIYMRYRSQLCELRINEVKRSVARLVEMQRRRSLRPGSGAEMPPEPGERAEAQRGGGQ